MLTDRELEILKLLVFGLENSAISEKLNISIHTTKAHFESIFRKLSVNNRVQAAIKSVALGIVNIGDIYNHYCEDVFL